MIKRFLLSVDDSQNTLEALENLGGLFLKGDAHFYLFHAVPESYLPARPPPSLETADWEKVQ
jgi:nucleotide-binding universal stress UspA family protein